MKTAWKILAFGIFLNIAVGIMITALPGVFTPGNVGGLKYNSTYADGFNSQLGEEITSQNELEDTSDQFDRVLDVLTLGFLFRFIDQVRLYMFGFIEMLYLIFGPYLEEGMRNFLFGPPIGVLKTALIFAYTIAAISLFTGRDFDK